MCALPDTMGTVVLGERIFYADTLAVVHINYLQWRCLPGLNWLKLVRGDVPQPSSVASTTHRDQDAAHAKTLTDRTQARLH